MSEFLPVRLFVQDFEYPHGMCFSIYRHRGVAQRERVSESETEGVYTR